jgi:hypothetical protein
LNNLMRRLALFSSLLLFSVAVRGDAQSTAASLSPNDSVFRRARRLVSEGNGGAGRAIVDSLLKREEEGTTAYGNALYWRGALAETAADAERDYRRVIVEYPLSAYSDDALLAIAELEQARGDRAGALAHLQRFVKEHPVSAARGTAAFAAARLAFEQRDTRVGCAMIADARASVPSTDVELRNQIDYYTPRCAVADAGGASPTPAPVSSAPTLPRDTTPVVARKPVADAIAKTPVKPSATKPVVAKTVSEHERADTTPTAKPVPAKVVSVKSPAIVKAARPDAEPALPAEPAAKAATRPRMSYTIQLAAYSTLAEAQRLVKKLATSGVKARVSGAAKPFRVRLDFYSTRQAALDEVAALKTRGIIGFVTTEEIINYEGRETPVRQGKTP